MPALQFIAGNDDNRESKLYNPAPLTEVSMRDKQVVQEKVEPNAFNRHSKIRILVHLVWSTQGRMPWITSEIEQELHTYIVGICRRQGCYVVAIGGIENHIHLLLYLSHAVTVSDLAKNIKGSSSRLACTKLGQEFFQWQRGYAAFGVGPDQRERVAAYVRNQKHHHSSGELWAAAEILADDAPDNESA